MRIERESILDEIVRRAPLPDRFAAEAVVDATLEVLGRCLSPADARALAADLPPAFAAALLRVASRPPIPRPDELLARVVGRQDMSGGRALEQVQATCRALAGALGGEARARLERALPERWAELFREPPRSSPADVPHGAQPGHGHTLATGKPGSTHPLAEARPPAAHADSIALADNPHAETKLSSGVDERAASLATGRPGADDALADAKDERAVPGKATR